MSCSFEDFSARNLMYNTWIRSLPPSSGLSGKKPSLTILRHKTKLAWITKCIICSQNIFFTKHSLILFWKTERQYSIAWLSTTSYICSLLPLLSYCPSLSSKSIHTKYRNIKYLTVQAASEQDWGQVRVKLVSKNHTNHRNVVSYLQKWTAAAKNVSRTCQ